MLLTLEVLPAHEGDCLILHWGTVASPHLAVIDGGPSDVYDKILRPRLVDIGNKRNLHPLPLDLVMVSHIDGDHITGIKKLFRKMKEDQQNQLPPTSRECSAKRLWHNTFNDILGDGIDQYYQTLTASVQASVGGEPNPALVADLAAAVAARTGESAANAQHEAEDIASILAGHSDGRDLRKDHKFLFDQHQTAQLNSPFQANGLGTLLTAERTPNAITIEGLRVRIVGPHDAEIQALQKAFDAYIKQKGLSVQAVLAAYADKSIPNLSSIVCLVESGGKRILLTGDARGDKVLDGLRGANLLDANDSIHVDVLKVQHHGSDRNTTAAFFSHVTADTYVISADGKYGNPDRATLEWLTKARGKTAKYKIVLTYAPSAIDKVHRAEVEAKGDAWDPANHSVEQLLTSRTTQGYQFNLVAGGFAKVELGDEQLPW